MKKLMFAAAVASALTGFSSVTSANVVGFQNSETCKAGAFNMGVATFANVGGGTTKLGDFKAVKAGTKSITQDNFNIQIYNKQATTATIADDPEVLKLIPAEKMDDFLDWYGEESVTFSYVDGSWWLTCDEDNDFPMDNYPIPYGAGFMINAIKSFADGAYLVYAGQVEAGEGYQSVTCKAGAFNITGNVAPCDFALKDFMAVKAGTKSITQDNFNIQFYNKQATTATIKDDPEVLKLIPTEKMDDFLDWYGEEAVTFSYVGGTWYLTCDEDNDFDMSDYPVKAGQGFMMNAIKSFADGAYLILPLAL